VTPAAVGQQVRALEDTLGVVLFRRTTKGLELTTVCSRCAKNSRNLLRISADFISPTLGNGRQTLARTRLP